MKYLLLIVFIAALGLTYGCQFLGTQQEPPSLYEQLGEREGIATIVEDMLYGILDDTRINEDFRGVDIPDLHGHLTDQLCELSGGPCTYTGRSMRESHAELEVTDTEFNALAEQLIYAMEKNDVPTTAQNRLIKRLVPLYPEIRDL